MDRGYIVLSFWTRCRNKIVNVILLDFLSSWTWGDTCISTRRSSRIATTIMLSLLRFRVRWYLQWDDIVNSESDLFTIILVCFSYFCSRSIFHVKNYSRSLAIIGVTWMFTCSYLRSIFTKYIYVKLIFKLSDAFIEVSRYWNKNEVSSLIVLFFFPRVTWLLSSRSDFFLFFPTLEHGVPNGSSM